MRLEIIEIKAVGNVKLTFVESIIDREESIWKRGGNHWIPGENLSKKPAAFLLNKSPAQLEVTLQTKNAGGKLEPGKTRITLKGVFEGNEFSGSSNIYDNKKKIVINVSHTNNPKKFTRLAGKFEWYIRDHKLGTQAPMGKTGLEFFWLYGKRKYPVFDDVFKCGIPVEILRRIAHIYQGTKKSNSAINKTNETDDKKILIEAAVNSCFYSNPPHYDINDQSHSFSELEREKNKIIKVILKLNKYWEAIKNPRAVCNCYDQAAVLQVFLKAVGITDVKYCEMNSSFFLRLTKLIGRGFCNDPKYTEGFENPIVYEKHYLRSCFYNHGFCILPENGNDDSCEVCIHNGEKEKPGKSQKFNCLVVDSCVGPHIGNETMVNYVDRVVDDVFPGSKPNGQKGEPEKVKKIKCYKGVTHINFTFANITDKSEWVKRVIKKDKKIINNLINNFVVRKWSNPKNCRVLKKKWKKKDWDTICKYEDIIPGIGETIISWILKEKGECIDIDLYVSSEQWASINRFLSIESLATRLLDKSPFKKVSEGLRKYLGPLSKAIETENYCRYLWVFYNVVFDVSLHNVTFKIKDLLKWLYRQGRCIFERKKIPWEKREKNGEKNIDKYLPREKYIICEHRYEDNQVIVVKEVTVKPGDLLTVKYVPPQHKQKKPKKKKDILLDFIYEKGDGLEIISKTDNVLKFRAVKPSENKNTTTLVVVALDKDTLLTRTKKYEITVR